MSTYTNTRDQITDAAKQQAFTFALHALVQVGAWAWNRWAVPKLGAHPFEPVALPAGSADGQGAQS